MIRVMSASNTTYERTMSHSPSYNVVNFVKPEPSFCKTINGVNKNINKEKPECSLEYYTLVNRHPTSIQPINSNLHLGTQGFHSSGTNINGTSRNVERVTNN